MLGKTVLMFISSLAVKEVVTVIQCDGQIHRYAYTHTSNTTKWRNMIWSALVFKPQLTFLPCAKQCLLLGNTCKAFAIKQKTNCILLGELADLREQPWVNTDGNWEVYPWLNGKPLSPPHTSP